MSYKKAFTIVEVLVVTVCIGILTIILAISYTSYLSTAKTAASKANAATAQKIAEGFSSEAGSYPDTAGKFYIGAKNISLPKELSVIADADDTTLNGSNGANTIAYACLDSCTSKKILGGRITYWDFVEKVPKYIFLGNAVANSSYDYPPVLDSIVSGGDSNCASANNNITYCWGYSGNGQFARNIEGEELSSAPMSVFNSGQLAKKTLKSISTGWSHTCAIASDDNAYCWGANSTGQLGDGSWQSSSAPVAVKTSGALTGKTILSISAGMYHTCVIASDNLGYCWGRNYAGQLGNGTTTYSGSPVPVSTSGIMSGKTFTSIAAGGEHTCAIANDNLMYCWGYNEDGRLGDNTLVSKTTPLAVYTSGVFSGKTIKSISTGFASTCAIANDNNPYCWGLGSNGQIGDLATVDRRVPTAVYTGGALGGRTVKSISAGNRTNCVIASDDNAYCWGLGVDGQLGNNTYTSEMNEPTAVYKGDVLNGKTVKSISSGAYSTCLIASDNNTYCWGANMHSALSQDQTKLNSNKPIAINNSTSLRRLTNNYISVGNRFGCLIASDSNAYCWGQNDFGQLGNNKTSNRLTPTKSISGVLAEKPLSTLSIYGQVCATDQSLIPYCWGDNTNGQTGSGVVKNTFLPTLVDRSGVLNGKTIKKFALSFYSSCAIASDDLVYCWGANNTGQLGNNSTAKSLSPVQVVTSGALNGKTIKDIASGAEHVCVIASDDLPYCWGNNGVGQLGNNTINSSSVPVAVIPNGALNGKTVKAISSGEYSTCVIASDNQVYCWGLNTNGTLGTGNTDDSLQPVAVNTSGALNNKTVKSIVTGSYHVCVIASDDLPYCWGANWDGELGNNNFTEQDSPVAVYTDGILKGKKIKKLSSGSQHTCAITTLNSYVCWGMNTFGQLGNNSLENSAVPVWVIF